MSVANSKSKSNPEALLNDVLHEDELQQLPNTYSEYKVLVSSQLEKKYQALIKIYQSIEKEPEFQTLLNTEPSSADRVKRFDTTVEKAGKLFESFAVSVELLGSALLPEASLKMKYRSMVASKANKGLRDRLESDEAKIQQNVEILYNQAKEVAIRHNIPVELIDQYFANEDYVAMDKLIVKERKCKHGLRYNPGTGQVKCIRKREVQRNNNIGTNMEYADFQKQAKPSCYQRRKSDCINTTDCSWEVGKRCKSKIKIENDKKKNAFVTYQNPAYNKAPIPSPAAAPANFKMVNNPLYTRVKST